MLGFSQPYLRKSASIRGCSPLFAFIRVHSRSKLTIAKRGAVDTLAT